MNVNECNQQGSCETGQVCVDTEGGYTCLCHDGFSQATSLCDDIDECANAEHGCYDWAHR